MSLAVRTITARWTSPFFTRPRGAASLTETTMMSPTPATRRFDPPSTLMHWTRFAPLLSATSRLDCIWIMVRPLSSQLSRSGVRFRGLLGLGLLGLHRRLGRLRLRRSLLLRRFLDRLGRALDDLDRGRLGDADAVDHFPGLQLRDRRALFDAHLLARFEGVGLVMGVVLLRQLDDLAVQRVLHPPLDPDHDRLVGLVGHHRSGEDALWHS